MDRGEIERQVLARITPGKLPDIVEEMRAALQAKTDGRVMLGGSSAKGTHLAGDHDFDFFVLFPDGTIDLSDQLEKSLLACWDRVQRVPGSRDYFLLEIDKYRFEFIPVLAVRSWDMARNVTDMSPMHVTYVKEKLSEQPGLRDDIRLSKQFCKACRTYGAESYIGGFSGYVLELLNIHYGSFRALLEAARGWAGRTVLDPAGLGGSEMNEDNVSPLILIDPVQPGRNAAAALTRERYERFIACAGQYIDGPHERFFTIEPLTEQDVQEKYPGSAIHKVVMKPVPGKDDVQGAKCLKACEYMRKQLQMHGFSVEGMEFEFAKEAVCFFAFVEDELSEEELIVGPPLDMEEHVAQFKEAHESTHEEGGRVHAVERREFTRAENLLKHLCTVPYVAERTKEARL